MAGSIDKRPNGKYRARWREYANGPQRAQHFDRKGDAERFLTRIQHELLTGAYVDPNAGRVTFEKWTHTWLARQHWRASTRATHESHIRIHVLPVLGKRPLATIKRGDIESWMAGMKLAPTTATTVRRIVGSIFRSAVEDGVIARSPMAGTRPPKRDIPPAKALRDEQVSAVLAATPDWYRAAVVLGVGAGLRQGEAAGLTVDRVDFLRRTVTIDRQLVTAIGTVPRFGPPKSDAGYRTIPVDQWVLDGLAAHLARFGEGVDALVVHRDGEPRSRQNMSAAWVITRKAAGLPDTTFHALRHTFASTLLANGISVKAVSKWLGHSDAAVTLGTYAHVMPDDDERGRAVIAGAGERWTQPVLSSVRNVQQR